MMKTRKTIIVSIIMIVSLFCCGTVFAGEVAVMPTTADASVEIVEDDSLLEEINLNGGNADIQADPRMGTGTKLFDMSWSSLGAGNQMLSTAGKTATKSSFTNGMMAVTSSGTSSGSGTYKIGLARYHSGNDIYVIEKYAQFTANSSSTTKYVDVSGLSSLYTYRGCIVNNTSGTLSGTAEILNYV